MKNRYVKKCLILCCTFIFMTGMKLNAANFIIADGDVTALANAIITSNTNSQPDTINLAPFGTYTLTAAAYPSGVFGATGLPFILEDGVPTNALYIFGNGATITRDIAAPKFRLMNCIQGTVYINDVTFSNGHIQSGSNSGGGLIVNGGTYYISNCTFLNNKSGFQGGGLFVWTSSTATVSNCTFTGNTAPMSSAICNWGATVLYIYNSTMAGNFTTGATGFGTVDNIGNNYTYLRNSIIANNTITSGSAEVNGHTISQGGNILGSANATLLSSGNPSPSGDNIGTTASPADAKVNAIADNGGFTQTMSLQSNSPAINKGNIAYIIAQDQRGYARVGVMDIGAFENGATIAAPVIATSGLSVTVGSIGTVLTISGINMTGITQIKFQGAAAVTTGFTNNTNKSVTVVVPAGTTSGKITVTTAVGTSVLSAQSFIIGTTLPVISNIGLSTTSGQIGSSLTITGTNLSGITQIKFAGAAAVTTGFTNNTATSVTVTVPAGAANGQITVTNAAGTSALSAQPFVILPPTPVIASTGLSPSSGTEGTIVTITGTNFTGITQIKFAGAPAITDYTNNTATSVTVIVPVGTISGKVTVSTSSGTSVPSTQTFVIIPPVPVIGNTGLSATSGPIGSSLTITGTDLLNITKIKFPGVAAITTGFTNNTATSVTVVVPVGASTGQITVTTAGGTSALSTQTFTITSPAPVIASTGLSITSGSEGSSLTITGTNFSGITQITFQGAAAVTTGFTNNTATSVTVIVPVGASTGPITVTTASGTSAASAQTFTITTATAKINPTLKNVELYPNPFAESVTIDLNGATQTTDVRIVSLTGEVLKQMQLDNYSTVIDTQFLDAGIYIVHVFNDAGEQMTYRMVKK